MIDRCEFVHNLPCEQVSDRIAELEKENARLHEYVTKLEQANIALDSDNTELLNDTRDMRMIVADNRNLRELVMDMMRFFEDGDWCTECNHARECEAQEQYEDDCLMRSVFRDRMRELGVTDD